MCSSQNIHAFEIAFEICRLRKIRNEEHRCFLDLLYTISDICFHIFRYARQGSMPNCFISDIHNSHITI